MLQLVLESFDYDFVVEVSCVPIWPIGILSIFKSANQLLVHGDRKELGLLTSQPFAEQGP